MISNTDIYFFEIPVYRCSSEDHEHEQLGKRSLVIQNTRSLNIDAPNQITANTEHRMLVHYDKNQWESWNYNEIVGWIKLHTLGSQIRGELWLIRQRITKVLKRKTFRFSGKLFEFTPHLYLDAAEYPERLPEHLVERIELGLSRLKPSTLVPDFTCFRGASHYLNWQEMLERSA